MVNWINFALRRRVSLQRFLGALPDNTESTIRARLLELQVDPTSFPWHELAATPAVTPAPEPPTPEPAAEPAADPTESPPEMSDG
jgi:hypothetical protein